MYIVCGHGSFASAMQEGIKMIVGSFEEIKYVDFKENMSLQELIDIFINYAQESNEELIFLCDLDGGTPCNAANYYKLKNGNSRVFTGVNLSMLISIATGEDIENIINIGKDSIIEK